MFRRTAHFGALGILIAAAVSVGQAATPIKLNAPLTAGGNIGSGTGSAKITPDNSRVIYVADQITDGLDEIFSVPSTGGTAIKLNGPIVASGALSGSPQVSPDSSRVLYHGDQDTNDVTEIFGVAVTGGAPLRLNSSLVLNGDVSTSPQFSPDGSRVLYLADQTTDTVDELFSVPSAGGTAVKLNGALVAGGNVSGANLLFSLDSSRVLYLADQTTDGVDELFSVPSAGGTPVKLNGPLVANGDVSLNGFAFSPDSSRVLYGADQTTNDVDELFSVPATGGAPIKLNGSLAVGGDVFFAGVRFSPDSSRIVYLADQDSSDVLEIFSVPIAGGTPVKLNGPMVTGGDVLVGSVSGLEFTPDGSRVVYTADQDIDGVTELFSVPSTGGTPVKLNAALVAGGNVINNSVQFSPDGSRVLYTADQDTDGVVEGYLVPTGGGTPVKLNSALVDGGDVQTTDLQFSSDGSLVLYRADQDTNDVTEVFVRVVRLHSKNVTASWDSGASWDHGVAPDDVMQVFVDGVGTLTMSGSTSRLVNELVIGGGSGTSTVQLSGSATLTATHGLTVKPSGVLRATSSAVVVSPTGFVNQGEINLGTDMQLAGGPVTNDGLLRGVGRVHGAVTNTGSIEAFNQAGELVFDQTVTNQTDGLIAVRASTIRFTQGLTNVGQLSFGPGAADIFGDIANTGTIGLSSGSVVSIVGDVAQNSSLNLLAGSRLIVFDDFTGTGGSTGPGTLEVLGTLSVGLSPAEVSFGGDLIIGGGANTIIELGGMAIGQFDRLVVGGEISFAGRLEVELLDEFLPAAGDTFEIVNATGGVSGTFSPELLPALGGGLFLDVDYGPNTVTLSAAGVLGDYNLNGTVDAADYTVWRNALGQVGGGLAADGDASGAIDAGDYTVWKMNFGEMAPGIGAGSGSAGDSPSHAAVPEPSSIVSLFSGAMCAIVVRTRRLLRAITVRRPQATG